mgnify:CR=1 FL=1
MSVACCEMGLWISTVSFNLLVQHYICSNIRSKKVLLALSSESLRIASEALTGSNIIYWPNKYYFLGSAL